MRRKVLQDIANTLCQMVVGWRMGDDYERMAELPDGTLYFDLTAETVRHSSGEIPELWITGELSAWLKSRLNVERVDYSKLVAAKLEVTYKVNRIKTNRKKVVTFDFECQSTLETDETKYEGKLVERHAYHQRVGA